ncbi:MAG: PspC domain-containing protein [Actinomycetota bacterium]
MAGVSSTRPLAERPRWQLPRLSADNAWLGGVAAGIANEIGVQPLVIRVSFVVLALAGGWGLVLYAGAWLALVVLSTGPTAPYAPIPKGASALHRHVAVAMIVLGLLLFLRTQAAGFIDQIVFPGAFVLTGFLVAWTRAQGERGLWSVARIGAGVVVGVGGMIAFLALSSNIISTLLVLIVALAVVSGITLVVAPSLARIGRDLDQERQQRVRADERARMAAHLHDSVLQTLALIQRHADDADRTARLARQQERELRLWLYQEPGDQPEAGRVRLTTALEKMAAELDARYGTPIKVIVVNDSADFEPTTIEPLLAAAGEACVNAATHSDTRQIDVFAECGSDRIELFVRDTGQGFDMDAAAQSNRRGISESIVGRMTRAGGSASVHSEPGAGTEVELVLPLAPATDETEPTPEPEPEPESQSSGGR